MDDLIQLLQAVGLDDISAALWGFLAGATLVALWISAWFVGESIFNRVVGDGFEAHADEATTLGNETAAKNIAAFERLGRSANR
jgi:hypothetical protein